MKARMIEETPAKMPGYIYRQVADKLLEEYFELPPAAREHRLTKDYQTLERQVKAEKALVAVTDTISYSLGEALNDSWIVIPRNLREIVLYDDDPDSSLEELRSVIGLAKLNDFAKSEIILDACGSAHSVCIEDSTKDVFMKAKTDRFYGFIPFELVGPSRVLYYLNTYIEPILSCLNLRANDGSVEDEYKHRQGDFLKREGIRNREVLRDVLVNIGYCRLPDQIRDVLSRQDSITSKILDQVLRDNPILQGE